MMAKRNAQIKKKSPPPNVRKRAKKADDADEEGSSHSRNLWTGSISFGLLNIPVGLSGAKEGTPVSFSLLDKRNFGHVGYKQYNKTTGREIPRDQIAKGYEYQKGKYVIVTDEDFKRANPRAVSTIDIEDFVDIADVDPMMFEQPYYLMPQKSGEKGYRLLREVLDQTKKAAVGKVVLFRKQRLVSIFPRGDYLVLEVLRFAREVLTVDEMQGLDKRLKGVKVSPREVEMAEALVKGMTAKWDPDKYEDTYHKDLMKLIQAKIKKGGVIAAEEEISEDKQEPESSGDVVDLMPLLKKSLEAGRRTHAKSARA